MSKITYRPISTWPGTLSKTHKPSKFSSGLPQTLDELRYELDRLDVKEAVIEIAVDELDLRRDGTPRMKAEFAHPGVVVSFDSKHGSLRYATDAFDDWRDNLRGIALSLARLRDMDRYGVTGRGEQYAGWRQIEAASVSREAARVALYRLARRPKHMENVKLTDDALIRMARAATHPDRGGRREDWDAVQRAAETLQS